MPFGFGSKKEEVPFRTNITNKDELDEIKKIAERLGPDEKYWSLRNNREEGPADPCLHLMSYSLRTNDPLPSS